MLVAVLSMLIGAAAPPHGNLAEELYWASVDASGSRLCDRARAARYGRQYEARYGARIRRLTAYHVAAFGPDPDFVVTTSCRMTRTPGISQDRYHARALAAFDARLRDLEARFGPAVRAR